jgi:tight adherence protein B
MGLLLGLCFAGGIAAIGAGVFTDARLPDGGNKLKRFLTAADLGIAPALFLLAVLSAAAVVAVIVYAILGVPALAVAAGSAGGWAPFAWARRRRDKARHERERAWPAVLSQLADGLEAGIAFPAAVALAAQSGPTALRDELTTFHSLQRTSGLADALDSLAAGGERTADTLVMMLRAGLLDLPAGGLAPVLRELSTVLYDRFESREKARSRARSLQVEATILALSPIILLLLVGVASPSYLDAYKTAAGTAVAILGGGLIFGCYVMMIRLGRIPEPRRTGGASR